MENDDCIYTENPLDNQLFVEFSKPVVDKNKVRSLIVQGADINALDGGGCNLLWNYIFDREEDWRWRENFDADIDLDEIHFLIDLGINVDYIYDGHSCLHLTVKAKDYETTKLLLDAGANPNCIGMDGSLLDFATDELEYHDFKKKEWVKDEEAERIWDLLADYGAEYSEDLIASEVEDFLIINASYSTGLVTRGGEIKIEDIPNVPKSLILEFNHWLKNNPDIFQNYYSDKIPNHNAPLGYYYSVTKHRGTGYFRMHNLAGRLFAKELKEIVGKNIKVEYYFIKAEDLEKEEGKNQGYLKL